MDELAIASLVAMLVANALSDTTAPPSWLLDILLKGVEKYVLHGLGLPKVFADICGRVAAKVSELTTLLLLQLGEINGYRRVVTTPEEVADVKVMLDNVKASIDALPNSARKERLQSFWQYQAGVFMARNGYYEEAAENELVAAREVKNPAEKAIAFFLGRVCTFWAVLVVGGGDAIKRKLAELVVEYRLLEAAMKGTAHEAQWGEGNGPLHVLQGYILAGLKVPDELWIELYPKVQRAAEKIPAFAEWATLLDRVRSDQAADIGDELIARSTDPTVVATARLLKARLCANEGKSTEARTYYAGIQPAPDCHQVAAVAARELAALPSP